jgi:hypothetical protein
MNRAKSKSKHWGRYVALLALPAAAVSLTGCQIDASGQTLPSPYYLSDDIQYFAPGPGFKLAREAVAQKEQAAAQVSKPQAE